MSRQKYVVRGLKVHELGTTLKSMGKSAKEPRSILSKNIVSKRQAKKWSQNVLAEEAEIHVNIIKKIERGKGEGEQATRQKIANALGCSLADLYTDPDKASPIDRGLLDSLIHEAKDRRSLEGAAHMVELFAEAPPKLRALVLAFLAHDFSLAREYFSPAELGRLMPPSKDR